MNWPQMVLGSFQDNPVAKLYNDTAIPNTILIGPDGKVVAKDLRGKKMEAAVGKLLAPTTQTAHR